MIVRLIRRVLRTTLLIVGAVVVAIVVTGLWLTTSLPQWQGTVTTAVEAPAEIIRDDAGATRIVAA